MRNSSGDNEHPISSVPAIGARSQQRPISFASALPVSEHRAPVDHQDLSAIAMSLDVLELAVLIFDGGGRPVFSNARADRLLRDGTALFLDASGSIRCRDKGAQNQLSLLISRDTAEMGNAMEFLALPRREGWPMAALVLRDVSPGFPPQAGAASTTCRVTLMIRDTEQGFAGCPERIAAVFGLSQAEADVVCRLSSGASLQEIACSRGVSLVTVRNQVKSVQSKMDVPRQAELVSLVIRTVQF